MIKKILIIVCVVAVIIVCAVLISIWARQPSTSTIIPTDTNTSSAQQSSPQKIDNAYFTATLPVGFTIKTNTENVNSTELVQIVATRQDGTGQQIAVTIGLLPADNLAGVSSYNLRVKNSAVYQPVEFGGMRADAKLFYSQTDSFYEITAFMTRASLYASVSASGLPNDKTTIDQSLVNFLDTWQWR